VNGQAELHAQTRKQMPMQGAPYDESGAFWAWADSKGLGRVYTFSMDQQDAIAKARQFADTAYGVEVDRISKESQNKLTEVRTQLAARGLSQSGNMTSETARIQGERITALLQARLDSLLEGYELHGVLLDEQLTAQTATEITGVRNTMISQATTAAATGVTDVGIGGSSLYVQLLEQNVGMYQNVVKTQLQRRRYMKKPEASITCFLTGSCPGFDPLGIKQLR
jgi:hypothetical protein